MMQTATDMFNVPDEIQEEKSEHEVHVQTYIIHIFIIIIAIGRVTSVQKGVISMIDQLVFEVIFELDLLSVRSSCCA